MAKQKPIVTLQYPVYSMEEVDRLYNAAEKEDCTWSELIKRALGEYLTNHNL